MTLTAGERSLFFFFLITAVRIQAVGSQDCLGGSRFLA